MSRIYLVIAFQIAKVWIVKVIGENDEILDWEISPSTTYTRPHQEYINLTGWFTRAKSRSRCSAQDSLFSQHKLSRNFSPRVFFASLPVVLLIGHIGQRRVTPRSSPTLRTTAGPSSFWETPFLSHTSCHGLIRRWYGAKPIPSLPLQGRRRLVSRTFQPTSCQRPSPRRRISIQDIRFSQKSQVPVRIGQEPLCPRHQACW